MSDYKSKARAARLALYADPQPGRDVLEALCHVALEAAPDDMHRRQWDRILAALAEGHRFKTSTFPAVFATGDEDVELIAAVEEVFEP